MKLSLKTFSVKPPLLFMPPLIVIGVLLLSSCGGGGSGSKGEGQKPDPVAVDLPIAYVERPIPLDEDGNPVYPDLLDPAAFNPGAKILFKDRATALAATIDITQDAFKDDPNYDPADPTKGYDVKDLSASADGKKLVFAMHAPNIEGADPEDQPTWNIWEYNLTTKTLHRIISSDIVAEAGQDLSPRYLADGSILFSSTRQTRSKAILLDDGKPQFSALEEDGEMPAYELHTVKADGTDIQQITYNQSHDLQPTVLQNGRVLYTHWDQFGTNKLSFYTANPDGTQVERSYGYFSMNPAATDAPMNRLFKPQEMSDGRIAAILKPDAALLGGDMVVVDAAHFFENDLQIPAGGGTGSAQNPISILPVNINIGTAEAPEFSKHGRFAALAPLYDGTNRLLVSWSQCRLIDPTDPAPATPTKFVACTDAMLATPGILEAPALYGIWIYNMADQSQRPVVLAQEGKMFTDPVTIEVRTPLTYYQPKIDLNLAKEGVGALYIQSVYDFDGVFSNYGTPNAPNSLVAMTQAVADDRPAHFVRFIKAVSIPDEDTQDSLGDNTYGEIFGDFDNRKEILGYAPVEADGSIFAEVTADVAFTIEVLDKDGKRINNNATKRHWLQLRPGEVRECKGCHLATNLTSGHGRSDAELPAINNLVANENLKRTLSVDLSAESGYSNLDPAVFINKQAPTSEACATFDGWTSLCRIIINYEQHIQPIWERERPTGACISCHSPSVTVDEVTSARVPAGQLDFGRAKANPANDPMLSYDQLLNARDEQILNDGGTLTTLIPVCEFVVDVDDVPECVVTLDANNLPTCVGVTDCPFDQDAITGAVLIDVATGNPIPLTTTAQLAAPMNRNGARANSRFFNRFNAGGAHSNYLNKSELKLLSEWLDLRANYYNNPFDSVEP